MAAEAVDDDTEIRLRQSGLVADSATSSLVRGGTDAVTWRARSFDRARCLLHFWKRRADLIDPMHLPPIVHESAAILSFCGPQTAKSQGKREREQSVWLPDAS
jgi:hypothetical protein